MFYAALLSFLLTLLSPFSVYAAVASASDAESEEVEFEDLDLINDLEVGNDTLLKYILSEVTVIRDAVAPSGLASDSDAEVSAMEDSEMDFDAEGFQADVVPFDAISFYADTSDSYYNALRFDVVIDGESLVLLFPPEHIDSLYVDSRDRLFNMSTSTISGRIVSEQFDPYAVTGRIVYLTPCLGNNFSSIDKNGSPNYIRSYYWSSGRLVYDDVYSEIIVEDYHYPFRVSETLQYILMFILSGGVLFLWLKSFRHY